MIDPYNPTGYAQVLKEIRPTTDTVYVLGHDIISQAVGTSVNYYNYDGHGSVRHLSSTTGAMVQSARYNYDAYGRPHGFDPQQATAKHLYAGEMFDKYMNHYYLRARWYNPSNGTFNRMDTYPGSPQDPQSLNKYLYAHCNPVNGIDPTGKFTIVEALFVIAIVLILSGVTCQILDKRRIARLGSLRGYKFKNNDLVTMTKNFQWATDQIPSVVAHRTNNCRICPPGATCALQRATDWDEWLALCIHYRIRTEGTYHDVLGGTLADVPRTPGQTEIVKYFESRIWWAQNPNIAKMFPPATGLRTLGDYPRQQGHAEIKRMEQVINECYEEAGPLNRDILGRINTDWVVPPSQWDADID